jgi:hypothetical protein
VLFVLNLANNFVQIYIKLKPNCIYILSAAIYVKVKHIVIYKNVVLNSADNPATSEIGMNPDTFQPNIFVIRAKRCMRNPYYV